ncbi:hypothetical protein PG997_011604 [Apiospora hydei]|uniref:Ecp2 effector protein-like domain-containing protein n=1 Tax=Apiospora hydei TaxID=1337664 RepID=A0ABR1VJI1_9PEZI
MQILSILRSLAFLFAFFGTTIAANGFAQPDTVQPNGANPDHVNIWARSIIAGPAAPTAPPEIIKAAADGNIPVTVNPALYFERIAPTIPQSICDTDNNSYENLTGVRGEGDASVYDCQALSGWLRDPANYGRFDVRGDQWDKTGRDYLPFLWTDHCCFGAFRTDFQPEDMVVGAFDVADVIDVSVKYFSTPYLSPPRVEADGFMYCQADIPFGWGLYNKFANQQNQFDVD